MAAAVRNVSAGSGYLGQHGSVHVLGMASGKTVAQVNVTWPDGSETASDWQDNAGEIVISNN